MKYPNVYGIDMPAVEELIAHQRSTEDICQEIGADWLIYQDLEDLLESVRFGNPDIQQYETCCFTGEYVTGDISQEYLDRLEVVRSDQAKHDEQADQVVDVNMA